MNFKDRVKSAVQAFSKTDNNYNGRSLARDFLRRGNNRPLWNDTAQIIMRDEELYKGYPYAAFNKRANKVAKLAIENLNTDADQKLLNAAQKNEVVVNHPYLDIIDQSPTFSNYQFWYQIATYLDLTGTFYLYARRSFNDTKIGQIQEFKLLNPYDIQRVFSQKELKVEGYIENRYGMQRTLDPRQIIDIRMLNPFDNEEGYGTAHALRDSQYTLNKSGDFTRHALANNLNSPGIVTIGDKDLALDDEQMKIFKSRIKGDRSPGEPIFGVGDGAIKWEPMQIDLDKAGLEKITDINREALTAVTGASLTMLGIERSGTTRDTAKVQKDLFTEDSAIPLLQLIVDALNQDYKVNYEPEYQKTKYTIQIENPLATDINAEIQGVQLRTDQANLVDELVEKGYNRTEAVKYAQGDIQLDQLTEPTKKEPVEEKPVIVEAHTHEEEPLTMIMNQFTQDEQSLINQNQGSLENAILNVEEKLVATVMNRVQKATNGFDDKFKDENDILSKRETSEFEKELALALAAFYTLVIPLYGKNTLDKRAKEFQLFSAFNMGQDVRTYIKIASNKASQSHIATIKKQLFEKVREKALTGASQQELMNFIRQEYIGNMAKWEAKRIARTETNRAFTQSQFFADKQFIAQNALDGRAYKKWITRSANPCPLCLAEAQKAPIPFNQAFFNLGEEAVVTYEENGKTKVLKQPINYETVEAGNLHVNCNCAYILIIE